jgi:hypothetical protein
MGPAVCATSRTADRSVPRPTGQRRSTAAVINPRPYPRHRHWTQRRHTASRSPAVARRGRTVHMAARRSIAGRGLAFRYRLKSACRCTGAGGRHGGPAACRLALAERPRRFAAAMTAVRRRPATPTKVRFGVIPRRPAHIRRRSAMRREAEEGGSKADIGFEGRLAPAKQPYSAATSNARL